MKRTTKAKILQCLVTGLGHIYIGKRKRGLTWLAAAIGLCFLPFGIFMFLSLWCLSYYDLCEQLKKNEFTPVP